MKITGQILKENREKKGISLNEVALATKINTKILVAMEEGDTERLPTKTFLRGFVRAYSRYLGLDEDAILNTFYEEMGSTKPKLSVTEDADSASPSNQQTQSKQPTKSIDPDRGNLITKIGAVGGIIILVILIVFLKKKMASYEREAEISDLPPVEIVQPDTSGNGTNSASSPTPVPLVDDEGNTLATSNVPSQPPTQPSPGPANSPVAAIVSTPSPTPAPAGSPSPAPTATTTPKSSPSPDLSPTPPVATATPKPSPTPSPTLVATPAPQAPSPTPSPAAVPTAKPSVIPVASPTQSPGTSPTPPAGAGKPKEVIIEALNNIEVEAQIDGEPSRKIKLRSDQVQIFRAKKKVILRFSDGGAVNLTVNGSDRGVPGDLGKPMKVELP